MKYLLLSLLVFTTFSTSLSAQDFVIRGKMKGLKKGVRISVLKQEKPLDYDAAKSNAEADAMKSGEGDPLQYVDDKTVASACVVKDGVFELRGHIERPQLVTLITNNLELIDEESKVKSRKSKVKSQKSKVKSQKTLDLRPSTLDSEATPSTLDSEATPSTLDSEATPSTLDNEAYKSIRWTYTPVFLDNTEYVISAPKYELLTNEPITDDCVITGGEAQADFNEYNRMKDDMKFIETHPTSVVSVYLADGMLTNGYNLSIEQIKHLESCITGCPIDPLRYEKFVERAKLAERTAAGNPVVDLSLATPDGEAKQLADILPKGKYVLVDFWASWCGICRAGTPRVKEIYKKYTREQFDVVSVSCDTSLERWKTAMEKDDMPWAQYVLTKQGYADFFAKYQTSGVPYLLLVSPEGKVIANPDSPEQVAEILEKVL